MIGIENENRGFNVLDRTQNPSAFATINLLSIISSSPEPLSVAEILEQRNGGIYPTRTTEELGILADSQLIEVALVEQDKIDRFRATNLGRMELLLQGVISPKEVNATIDEALRKIVISPPSMPLEKYGNEEFRFTWDSVAALLKKIVKDNSNIKPKVLALGGPTISYFGEQCPEVIDCYLLDINNDVVNDINERAQNGTRASMYDAREPVPPTFKGKFDAVVFDPPWHNEFYSLFADRGYDMLRPYGKLYISTPAPATRPEAAEELSEIYRNLMRGGFNLIEVVPEYFGYQIPAFERNIFKEQGIEVTSRGKYGQLVIAQANPNRIDTCSTPESLSLVNKEKTQNIKAHQDNYDLGDLYLPVDLPEDDGAELSIERLSIGVYLTTSRSQRREQGVNFISRDHAAFKINNPARFMEFCTLSLGESEDNFIHAVAIKYGIPIDQASREVNEFNKTSKQ